MTDEALDLFEKQVILDALRFERENTGETKTGFSPSKKYQHQMREMVADPQGWCQRKMRTVWKKALRRVAAAFLAATVGVSVWLAVDTDARAAFVGWVRELYEHSIVYRVAPVKTATVLLNCFLYGDDLASLDSTMAQIAPYCIAFRCTFGYNTDRRI